jgi:TolB-like protein
MDSDSPYLMGVARILILPFGIENTEDDHAHLSDGILEELIDSFSQVPSLQVCSRITCYHFYKNPVPIQVLKDQFDIDYLIEGHLKSREGTVSINFRLLRTEIEEQVLGLQLPMDLDHWTVTIRELVSTVQGMLDRELTVVHQREEPNRAREYYLRGLYHWHRHTFGEIRQAITYFKRAIQEDSDMATAYSALSDCYSIIGVMGYENPSHAFVAARKYADRALILDDKKSDSYVSAAFIDVFFDKDFAKAKANLDQALRLNGENIKARHVMAMCCLHERKINEALEHSLFTVGKEPFAIPHHAMSIRILMYMRDYPSALELIDSALKIDRESIAIVQLKGLVHLLQGNLDLAIENFRHCVIREPEAPLHPVYLAIALARAGFVDDAKSLDRQVMDMDVPKDTGLLDYFRCLLALGFHNERDFFKYMERALQTSLGFLVGEFLNNPLFDSVVGKPKFRQLLESTGLEFDGLSIPKRMFPAQLVTLTTDTAETLSLDIHHILYIESDDNYSIVHWMAGRAGKKKELRIALKKLEKQLAPYPFLVRCHKSFMINMNNILRLKGDARTAYFESPDFDRNIPISRAKLPELKARFNAIVR